MDLEKLSELILSAIAKRNGTIACGNPVAVSQDLPKLDPRWRKAIGDADTYKARVENRKTYFGTNWHKKRPFGRRLFNGHLGMFFRKLFLYLHL